MKPTKAAAVLGITLSMSLLAVDVAEARRGGSFGSRGARTYTAAPPTRTAPQATAPVQRSMTPQTPANAQRPAAQAPANAAAAGQRPGGMFGGMGMGLLGGLAAGGLLGWMMGNGFGGLNGGMMQTLMQVALIGLGVFLLMMLFRRRRQTAQPAGFAREAGAGAAPGGFGGLGGMGGLGGQTSPFQAFTNGGGGAGAPRQTYSPANGPLEIAITTADRADFERLLIEVQAAFADEDYSRLRSRTTPEIMSYLSEELSQNATQGRRNAVEGVKLLEADVAEAWHEDGDDYATAAIRFESIDTMRDRATGEVLEGDPNTPTETTELWTFVRSRGGVWKLSAIQET